MLMIRAFLFTATVLMAAGGMNCQNTPCPSDKPVLNPATGECEADDNDDGDVIVIPGGPTGPAGPGTGGLPTEPDTDTSMSENGDPDAVNLLIFGLNGRWLANDTGRLSCILHSGNSMTSTLIEERVCDHQDPDNSTISYTFSDLEGTVAGDIITGTTVYCHYGNPDPSLNGIKLKPMMLMISEDGKTLSGTYEVDGEALEFSLMRQTVGTCQGGEDLAGNSNPKVIVSDSNPNRNAHGGGSR